MLSRRATRLYLDGLSKARRVPINAVMAEAFLNQFHSPKDLRALQLEKLNNLLNFAREQSPYYGHILADLASPVRSTEELEAIAPLSKSGLVENMNQIVTPTSGRPIFRSRTSGSTGIALDFVYDGTQLAWSEAVQWRGRSWWGLHRGARQVVLWGRPIASDQHYVSKSSLKHLLRNSLQFNTFRDFDEGRMTTILKAIKMSKPDLIYGYGSSIGRLASFMEERGILLGSGSRPRLVEYTADTLTPSELRSAATVFGCPVVSAYGASETPGISQQCWAGGMHVSTDNVVLEVIRSDGSPAEVGEAGDLVVSCLNNWMMPLIRYRIGDVGALRTENCRCGNPLPLMDLQIAKTIEFIETSTRAAVSAHFLDYVNISLMRRGFHGIQQFFLEQTSLDQFTLRVVRGIHCQEATLDEFQRLVRASLGEQIDIQTEFVHHIPVSSSGKRHYFARKF